MKTRGQKCHACGESYTKKFFEHHPHVCNLCMASGDTPTELPYSPEALEAVAAKEKAKKERKKPSTPLPPELIPHPPTIPNLPGYEHQVTEIEALEVAERVLMRRSLLHFVQRFKPDYKAGWVHADICRRLERFMKDVEEGKSPRLLLCMPPRHGKSTLTSNFFPPWVLGHHPDWEIIAASHTQSLALKFSGFIRDMLRDPAYQALFSSTALDPDSQSKESWSTTRSGGYLAAGVGTGITGRGAHVLIVDDPVKDMEAADSMTIRDNTWEWYVSTAYTRLAPGGGVLGILTLWNEDDWGGRIIEVSEGTAGGDKFEIVRYPAINEGYAEYMHPDQRTIVPIYPGPDKKYPPPPPEHTLLRAPGEALHPARYDLEALLRIKANYYARGNQRVWHALYQQRPSPEDGVFFTKPMFKYYSSAPSRRYRTVYQAWDFAITEQEHNDYTVGVTLLQDENDALYILDVNRFRSDDSVEIVEAIIDYAILWDADLIGFEDGQIWKTMAGQYEKRARERIFYTTFETLVPLTDKRVRAMPLRGRMQLGKVFFPEAAPWLDDCRKELLSFGGGGKHDDQVDALAWAVRLTLSKVAPTMPVQQNNLKSWRDKLNSLTHGDAGHMSA